MEMRGFIEIGMRTTIPSFILLFLPFGKLRLFSFAVIDLCQTAFAGFAEAVVEIDAGLVHGTADHIVADIPGAGEEIAQVAGVHGPHGSHGVALDAGNLNQTADGVAG